jgi:hypothetical protein
MHHYLVPYIGEGTDRNPFRPHGSDQPGWSAIDLRPDVTVLDGFALLAVPVRADAPERRYLGDALDTPSAATRQELDSRLTLTLEATTLREQIAELLIAAAGGSRWKPLRPTQRGVYEINLGGRIYERPVMRGGTTITESFNQADNTVIGPDLTWTELTGNSQTLGNKWATGATQTIYDARADSDLATDDHYAQGTIVLTSSGSATDNMAGVIARQRETDTTRTHYGWRYRSGSTNGVRRELYRRSAGTLTALAGPTASSIATDDLLRLECDGSTITGKLNGATEESVTDTNVTGNLRCGVTGQFQAGTTPKVDSFEAGDLTAGDVSITSVVGAAALAGLAAALLHDFRLTPTTA